MRKPQRRRSLFRKQVLATGLILLIGVLVIASVYNLSTVRYFREQTEGQARSVIRQTRAALEDKITRFDNLIGILYLNPDLQNLLFNEYYYDVPALVASRQIATYLAPVSSQFSDLFGDVERITVYTTNKTLRMLPGELEPLANAADAAWLAEMEKDSVDRTRWMLTKDDAGTVSLSAIRRLRNLRVSSFSANFLGYLKLDFSLELFFSSVLITAEGGSDWLLLTDEASTALAASQGINAAELSTQLHAGVDPATAVDGVAQQRQTLRVDNTPYVAWGTPVGGTSWICWYAISEQAMMDAMNRVNLPVLVVLFGMTFAMGTASWFATSRLTRRIERLAGAMAQLEEGVFDVRVTDHGKDEIGVLSDGFNDMASRLGELVRREYLDRMRQRESDLNALQAQLHPHFLYNTLASVSWLGMQADRPEIPAISNALARFYRLSLSKGKNFIHVADEIKQAQAYLEIMGIRYRDKIRVTYDVPDTVAAFWTLKLILQPFVENAILHGMSSRPNGIHITVSAHSEDAALVLCVTDDGVGVKPEILSTLLEEGEESGYGIANVHSRIRTYFGESYGVAISSRPGAGTSVTLRIPLLRTAPASGAIC